jgi:SAM-dependent methyltransferase
VSAVAVGSQPASREGASGYDLELFERLNEEYRSKPLVPAAPRVDPQGRMVRARKRLKVVSRDLDFEGKEVLEIGCAQGQMTHLLVKKADAKRAVGVDVVPSDRWEEFGRERVSFHVADLASDELLPEASMDAVVSSAVLEHVRRPVAMLAAIGRVLRLGGRAWLYFNLHRGPKASHRYREVFFPWPHLLFESGVCRDYYRKHHDREATFAWVNRMTAAEYFDAFREVGLHVERYERSTTAIDLDFYRRFDDVLGRYPALDLETDFLMVVLRKRRRAPRRIPSLGYVECQRALDEALAAHERA